MNMPIPTANPARRNTEIERLPERLAWPLVLVVLLGFLYFSTLCPTIYPGDGPELTSAAWCLGIPHPTGYPLFMVLGFLAQRALPLVEPALVMNILTALCSLVAAPGVYLLTRRLMEQILGEERGLGRPVCIAAFGTAFFACAGAGWWGASTSMEVYALLMAFVVWIWVVGIELIRQPSQRKLILLAVLTGFAFLHHQLVLVTLPMSAAGVWKWWRCIGKSEDESDERVDIQQRVMKLLGAVLIGMLPLLGYAYLPYRAASEPPINIGDPSTFERMVSHLRGGQYGAVRVLSDARGVKMGAGAIAEHLGARLQGIVVWIGSQTVGPEDVSAAEVQTSRYGEILANEWTGKARIATHHREAVLAMILLLLAGMGAWGLCRRNLFVGLGLLGGLALNLVIVLIYTIADINIYQLPLWLIVVMLAAIGPVAAGEMLAELADNETLAHERWIKRVAGVGVAFMFLGMLSVWNYRFGDNAVAKQHSTQAKNFGDAMMVQLPENAVVLTFGDFDIYPLWYAQVVEGKRPDVAVVGANFIFQGWYRAMLRTNLPAGVRVYVNDRALGGVGQWLEALIGGCIAPQLLEGRPVFICAQAGHPETMYLSQVGLNLETVFRFDSPLPEDHPEYGAPMSLVRIRGEENYLRQRYAAFLESPRFPDARENMVESGYQP
ncbi:MAG: protein O-mannosyl-transferase family [Candidatus Sumerlaeota bacterium]